MENTQLLSAHRQRKRDTMVRTILDAARDIMREKGVAALTMQELSRRMDLRAPSLYHYFSSKMDLYDALFRQGFELYGQQMQAARTQAHTWQEYVRLSFEIYLSFALENPDLYQLCFERPVPGFTPSPESLALSFGLLEQSQQDVRRFKVAIRTDLSAEKIVDLVIAMMHGVTAMHLANDPALPLGEGRFGSLVPSVVDILEKAWS